MPGIDPPAAKGRRQYGKLPRGLMRAALANGLSARCLRTLARIAIHTSGNPDGQKLRTATIARHVGVSRRTVQRDVRELQAHVPELRVKRDRPKGERRRSYPNEYSLPQVGLDDPGTMVFAELTTLRAWREASATQQGILLYLLEVLGPNGHVRTWAQLADETGRAPSTVRQSAYYWRDAGVLEVEAQTDPEVGQVGNWLRVRSPGDVRRRVDPPTAHQRRAQVLAPVVRWCGLRVAALAIDDPEAHWWRDVGEAVEDANTSAAERVTGMLTQYLNGAARELGFKGSGRTRDVFAALPYVWERRDGFDREIAEQRADDAPRVTDDARAWGAPWVGDWLPSVVAEHAPVDGFDPSTWPDALEAMNQRAVESGGEALGAFWLGRLRPVGVSSGALVVVVPDPCAGDSFAEDHVRHLADAIGGRVSLRLASYQRDLDAEAAHVRLRGEWSERMESVLQRAAAVEAAVDAVPAPPRVRVGDAEWKAANERSFARIETMERVSTARAHARSVLHALERFAEVRDAAWSDVRAPDWLALEASAAAALTTADDAEASAARVCELGPMPGAYSLREPPPGARR